MDFRLACWNIVICATHLFTAWFREKDGFTMLEQLVDYIVFLKFTLLGGTIFYNKLWKFEI